MFWHPGSIDENVGALRNLEELALGRTALSASVSLQLDSCRRLQSKKHDVFFQHMRTITVCTTVQITICPSSPQKIAPLCFQLVASGCGPVVVPPSDPPTRLIKVLPDIYREVSDKIFYMVDGKICLPRK